MRITGGALLGRRVLCPPGFVTRPATDMLRVALFNMLRRRLREATILDLFAGTGVLSFEALSRGAKLAVLVENNPKALEYINKNIQNLNLADKTRLIRRDVLKSLPVLLHLETVFDICFVDPPYAMIRDVESEALLADFLRELHLRSGLVAENGITMVRYPKDDIFRRYLKDFQILRRRQYGSMEIVLLARPGVEIVLGRKHPFDRKRRRG